MDQSLPMEDTNQEILKPGKSRKNNENSNKISENRNKVIQIKNRNRNAKNDNTDE